MGEDLKSPFIPQQAFLDKTCTSPAWQLTWLLDNEKERYQQLKKNWDNGTTSKSFNLELRDEPFLPCEEYLRHGETRFLFWRRQYSALLDVPSEEPCEVDFTEFMKAEVE